MTRTEFNTWVGRASTLLDEVRRFVDARADMNGDKRRDLLDEWFALLAETSAVDANKVLDLLLSGDIQRPDFFDVGRLAGLVARESRALATSRNSRRHYGEELTYRCPICRDAGFVNVWNPHFVEAYRSEFAKVTREAIDRDAPREAHIGRVQFDLDKFDPERTITVYRVTPATWLADAARWWRSHKEQGGPIHHIALCNCDGDRVRLFKAEREKFRANERRIGTRDLGMPACGMADYQPRVMPLKTQEPFDDLANWYAEHEMNDVYEWTPDPADYARFA